MTFDVFLGMRRKTSKVIEIHPRRRNTPTYVKRHGKTSNCFCKRYIGLRCFTVNLLLLNQSISASVSVKPHTLWKRRLPIDIRSHRLHCHNFDIRQPPLKKGRRERQGKKRKNQKGRRKISKTPKYGYRHAYTSKYVCCQKHRMPSIRTSKGEVKFIIFKMKFY